MPAQCALSWIHHTKHRYPDFADFLVFRGVPAVFRSSDDDTVALCVKAVVQTVRDSHGSHEPVPRNSSPDQAGSCQRCEFPQSAVRQAASTNPVHHRWAVENRESICAGTVFAEIPERCRQRCEWGNCVVSFTDYICKLQNHLKAES